LITVIKDIIYYLLLFVTDNNGNAKTGLAVTYIIYKTIDNSIIDSGSLVDLGNGVYKNNYTFTENGQYYIVYNTPVNYTNEIETVNVTSDIAKESTLLRVLGLSDENKKITDTVHDANGNLTYAIVKLYPSATDFDNETNMLASYEFNAVYNINGLMQDMGVKRIS